MRVKDAASAAGRANGWSSEPGLAAVIGVAAVSGAVMVMDLPRDKGARSGTRSR